MLVVRLLGAVVGVLLGALAAGGDLFDVVRGALTVLRTRELVRPAGGAWEVVDARAAADLLNDAMRLEAMRDVLDRKVKLGVAATGGC